MHADGRHVVLASSASSDDLDHYVDLLDAQAFVHDRISADDADQSKPAPDIFAAALERSKIAADEAIVVGDTPYDIEDALRCGIRAVAVRTGGFSDQRLGGAIAIYSDVAALADDYAVSPLAR